MDNLQDHWIQLSFSLRAGLVQSKEKDTSCSLIGSFDTSLTSVTHT